VKIGGSFISLKQMLAKGKRYLLIFFCLSLLLPGISSFAQDYPEYEEIALLLEAPDLGGA